MHQNDFSVPRKDDVRPPRKIMAVEPEPIAKTVQAGANDQLGFRIPGPDLSHDPATHFLAEYVCHRSSARKHALGPMIVDACHVVLAAREGRHWNSNP